MNEIRIATVVSGPPRDGGSHDVDLLSAEPSVNLVEPNRRAAFCRQKKFRDDKIPSIRLARFLTQGR